ncbi:cytochrome P450 [Laetiporus sulphureus 93-53]|uniref:Cytochrome P450 n=1 Tax=Laetiporus sulphureus 93-53 TaxID=1314785 RepID=A0A165C0Q7_9APHY|nr:cytochrome P450 [Laetiporus sulphureus 93-53]KZT01991.1 cytochrome P450 [Laetiporus sulphureus 93-53]
MLLFSVEAALLLGLSFILWRSLQSIIVRSPLNNIPGPPRESFIKGNFGQLYHRQAWDFHRRLWEKYGSVVKLYMLFGAKCLYISDPKAIHHILVADQYSSFDEPPYIVESYRLVLGPGLLSATGEHHRRQRKMLNPVFSTKNLRDMLPVFYKVIEDLRTAIAVQVADGPKELNMLHWMNRVALELIGQAGLGYSFDPIVSESEDDFAGALKSLFPALSRLGFARQLIPRLVKIGSPSLRRRIIERIPNQHLKKLLDIVDTMDRKAREILQAKESAMQKGEAIVSQQVGKGKDLMSMLLKANMEADRADKLSKEELLGQMSTFVIGATDTTSSALAQILQYLADNPVAQETLRREIVEARKGGDMSYEEVIRLPYLDAVIKETLRLNPPGSVIVRQAKRDATVSLSSPIRGVDGKMMHEIVVPKGTFTFVGILALNRSKAIWGEDASEWKPGRWLSPLPDTVAGSHIPGIFSSIMTFSGGTRACIGFKFAELDMKVLLSVLVESFSFSPSKKPVTWNFATVRFPTVGEESLKPELPIVVQSVTKV